MRDHDIHSRGYGPTVFGLVRRQLSCSSRCDCGRDGGPWQSGCGYAFGDTSSCDKEHLTFLASMALFFVMVDAFGLRADVSQAGAGET